jgi:hypothetical protein
MLFWKIYFFGMTFMVLFSFYFMMVTGGMGVFELLNMISNLVLLVGGYSYIFNKKLLTAKNWGYVFKGLLVWLGFNLLYQVWPSSYVGDFSFLNGALFTNVFVFMLVTSFLLPLYNATYLLTQNKKGHKR